MIYQGSGRTPVHEVIIHCSATRPTGWFAELPFAEQVAEIRRWHTTPKPDGRGWRDIGYHRIIGREGQVAIGRSLYAYGAHVKGRNRGTVGICLIGGHGAAKDDDFFDHFTHKQDAALRQYLKELGELTDIRKISGHSQYANKACPGFDADARYGCLVGGL